MDAITLKELSEKATAIFCTLLNHVQNDYLKIENEPFMPLNLERIAGVYETPHGAAEVYSLCHYGKQNGDFMKDPEMCFLVIDQRGMDTGATEEVAIFPYSYQNDYVAHYEESVLFDDVKVVGVHEQQQQGQAEFANGWLLNLQGQGFLDKIIAP